MKNLIKAVILFTVLCGVEITQAQEKVNYNHEQEPDELIPQPFTKKFHWGIGLQTYFTSFTGNNLAANYFTKPSLGIQVQAEYFPVSYLGIGVGIAFQQRGAGVTNSDKVKLLGDPDSTYIERIRFNTVEFPVSIILRSNDVVRGMRLSASISAIPMLNFESNDVVHSVSDGNHKVTNVDTYYQKNDLLFQISAGPDINTGSGIFRVHLVYFQGTKNIYESINANGYNVGGGIKLTWLF